MRARIALRESFSECTISLCLARHGVPTVATLVAPLLRPAILLGAAGLLTYSLAEFGLFAVAFAIVVETIAPLIHRCQSCP